MQAPQRILLHSLLVLSLALPRCAHRSTKQEQFAQKLAAGRCQEAYLQLPVDEPEMKLVNQSKQALGTVSSYAVTGGGYVVEVLWDIAGGTAMAVVLCGPMLLALAASSGGGNGATGSTVTCLPGDLTALGAPPIGRRSYQATSTWRCPDLTAMSRSLREVSACYQQKGTIEDLRSAKQHLESLHSSTDFYACLPNDERAAIDSSLRAVSDELARKEVSAGN